MPSDPVLSLPAVNTRPVHSEKLLRRLTAHRVAAVQAELLDRPDVALAALTAHLATQVLRDALHGAYRCANVLDITATDNLHALRSAAEDIETSAAGVRMQAQRKAWLARLPSEPDALFAWLLGQDHATVLQLLTFVVAVTVNGIYGTEPERQSNEPLAQALGLDMNRWWQATGASYFNHVSKSRILDVVTEAVDANAASPLAALKKDAVVAGAEQTLAGIRWLPAVPADAWCSWPGSRRRVRKQGSAEDEASVAAA